MDFLRRLGRFLAFTAIAFGPVALAGGGLWLGIAAGYALSGMDTGIHMLRDTLVFAMTSVIILATLAAAPAASYWGYRRQQPPLGQGRAIYAGWLAADIVFCLLFAYLNTHGFGGAGVAPLNLNRVVSLFAIGQMISIPWIAAAVWVMRKFLTHSQ